MIIREHEHGANGVCLHCGARGSQATCTPRHVADPPRPRPPQFGADPGAIGELMRENMAKEAAARAGVPNAELPKLYCRVCEMIRMSCRYPDPCREQQQEFDPA